ncbi:hypothetical protein ACFYSC_36185 [Streptosporangium sp. NPDC004379]|uniref:hypothetical protein n=1 Tax=Streptosporangium sp. NPDC004379 TaxID=3366189 RepID=UPI00367FC598
MEIGFTGILLLLMMWAIPVLLFFIALYWAIRLAIRHEKRRVPTPQEILAQERRERMAAERAAHLRDRRHRLG